MVDGHPKRICDWCEKAVSPTSSREQAGIIVCLNCYQLLINAGVTMDAIFAPKPHPEKNAPPKKN